MVFGCSGNATHCATETDTKTYDIRNTGQGHYLSHHSCVMAQQLPILSDVSKAVSIIAVVNNTLQPMTVVQTPFVAYIKYNVMPTRKPFLSKHKKSPDHMNIGLTLTLEIFTSRNNKASTVAFAITGICSVKTSCTQTFLCAFLAWAHQFAPDHT